MLLLLLQCVKLISAHFLLSSAIELFVDILFSCFLVFSYKVYVVIMVLPAQLVYILRIRCCSVARAIVVLNAHRIVYISTVPFTTTIDLQSLDEVRL